MKKLILFSLIILALVALKNRPTQHLRNFHMLNQQLCKEKNGVVCGFIQKDCCATTCQSKFLGLNEVCSDGKFIDLDSFICQKICGNKGGQLYFDKILATPKCCRKGLYSNDKCPVTAQIQLGQCESETLTDRIVGLVNK